MSDQDVDGVYDEIELIDLGDARKETKQVWIGPYPDNQYGHGAFPGFEE